MSVRHRSLTSCWKDIQTQSSSIYLLAAYTNFKIKGITLKIANKPFLKAFEFTKLINNLEADRNFKALFPIPEKQLVG